MGFTVVRNFITVEGNKRVSGLTVTADAASGVVDSGLLVVESIGFCPVSMGTAGIKIKKNLNAASAASNGQIMVSSAVNGDAFELIITGH